MAAIKTSTKPPSGLSITRSGGNYTFTWKLGDSDYDEGQQMRYHVNGAWTTAYSSGHKKTTTWTIGPGVVKSVGFAVKGRRKNYTKKKKSYNPDWSKWADLHWNATAPSTPSVTYSRTGLTSGTFSWSIANDASGANVFTSAIIETCATRGASPSGWVRTTGQGASGSRTYNETLSGQNLIRWFRVKAIGVGGLESGWVMSAHCYGNPAAAVLQGASAQLTGSVTRITAQWAASSPANAPVDTVEVQYAIAVPTDANLTAPSSGWSDAIKVNGNGRGDKVVANVSEQPGPDECVWVRIQTTHDEDNHSYSGAMLAYIGQLQAPDFEATPDGTTGDVAFSVDPQTACEASYTAIFYRNDKDPSNNKPVIVLPFDTTTATVNIPEVAEVERTEFVAFAFVGTYDGTSIDAKMRSEDVFDQDIISKPPAWLALDNGSQNNSVRITWPWSWDSATSAELSWADHDDAWESTAEPSYYKIENKRVESWVIAGLELGKRWFFQVRFLYEGDDENITGPWSQQYSFDLSSIPDRPALTLSKNVINEGGSVTARWGYTSEDGTTQAYADICLASYDNNHNIVYGDIIAHVETGQSVELVYDWETNETYFFCVRTTSTSGRQSEWSEPTSLFVAPPITIDVTDISLVIGYTADEYALEQASMLYYIQQTQTISMYASGINVVNTVKLNNVTIDPQRYTVNLQTGTVRFSPSLLVNNGDSLEFSGYRKTGAHSSIESFVACTDENLEKYRAGSAVVVARGVIEQYYLDQIETAHMELRTLPLSATVTGAGDNGTTIMAVVRAEDYHIYRPDDSETDGYAGEQIVAKSQIGEDEIVITLSDLVGYLDDGAKYLLKFTVQDEYGQTATDEIPFTVNWTHKAGIPSATAKTLKYERIVTITPVAPESYVEGDVVDIYRLTMDKPELIIEGGEFGTTYVDPYPGFGDICGHRLVTRTENGDYITSDNMLAWTDIDEDDGDLLEDDSMIIDVNGDQIELPYNLELSNTWHKDFVRTTYLGGSIQGDWNPAVTRDLSANTVVISGPDLDKQVSMRGLAGYAGQAHVRTPDGSSFACDIQVRESQDYQSKKVSYSLTIQAIDPQAPEGMTLEEWREAHPV